jgi:citrate synthase
VASARSTPYAVVLAGLAALRGTRHGGHSERVEAFFSDFEDWDAPAVVAERIRGRLQRGEAIPGFGQPLYPNGDPRSRLILELLTEARPGAPFLEVAQRIAAEVQGLLGEWPNLDFSLGALSRVLGLRRGSSLTLFALGRTVGWIAHAIEQYQDRRLIRPRARYTGPAPGPLEMNH